MSLDCEGDGAPCVECGEFDFLPYACLRCGGTFCAAHTICHHIPGHAALTAAGVASALPLSEAQGDAEVSKAAPLCMPLQGVSSTLTEADATPTSSALFDRQQHRCAVCQSVLCALAPCPQCGDCYCAAHRFHGHEDITSKKWQQLRANPRAVFFGQRGNNSTTTVDPIAALCSTFTSAHPLVLAPVGYRSRRMSALALIVAPATAVAMAFTGTPMSGSEGSPYTIGVCSLIVATEMSVGQLCDRLVGFLRDAWIPVMEQEQDSEAAGSVASLGWSEWVSSAPSSLLSVVPAVPTPDSTAAVGSAWRRVPALSLVQLPADVILRKAPIVSATVLLRLADTTTAECTAPEADVALRRFMTTILYGKAATSSTTAPWTSAMASAHRDDRVKALATRLYLQQQLLCRATEDAHESTAASADVTSDKAEGRSAQLLEGRTGASVQGIGTVVELTPDAEGDITPSPTTVSDAADSTKPLPVVAVWPFRHAPPLNNFNFFNSKLNPCGIAAIRPAAAPRVVVAVFVVDATLPVAVMPMCIAVGHNWPLARVVDRIREEVGEQQLAQHRDARAALNTFSVHHLGNGSGASSAAAGIAREPVCLWSGYAQPFTSSTPVTLQSADVLLLCPADSPGAEVALREELQRLRGLTGKAKAALKADQVKKCTVM
ncbi:hypothetical protein LPMP_250660 [Leishmania panamensis]|uniref:C2H2-type domain-containing protein n=1 Tax=Leishmania panamensis TaxID=5679 RepID=A0A088RSP2_LEIPA|nr:hypothetical protein LPMP_250660 [Leishmania panamensis]AIN98930.1 hypothetical protein LPMP_250660 [Leishmania panamensis]